ncbi:MAG: tRNA (adenosine(37)-N6)-threonylcarbamoyltransferase complex dimerization subunit type 1 TsaB [Bacteroidales bacterium]|nr:tRNA (adenosine(37)-N6)-threonylcarbamoyltransferase complex dimerization subunit type 1 TsaB [Bacteroidales bacterium]
MTFILNIETSGEICSVSLSKNKEIIAYKESSEKNSHSTKLAILTDQILKETSIKPSQLKAIAVSQGPGSYTGLRIGVAFAKGLCYANHIPLLAVDTLMIYGMQFLQNQSIDNDALICPMIDARRMEVYTAIYDSSLKPIMSVTSLILNENSFESYKHQKIYFIGSGLEKWRTLAQSKYPNYYFVSNILPYASAMASLSYTLYNNQHFVDVAYFEPFYLKEFMAGTSVKNKLI